MRKAPLRRRNDVALIGIVLVAIGIAILADTPIVPARVLITSGLWSAAVLFFRLART